MKHMMRAGARAAVRDLQHLAAIQDPTVREYLRSRMNWFFLFVALVMYAVAWPTLPMTHQLPAYALPAVAAFAAFPIALAWSSPLLGWAVSVVSAQLIGIIVPTANGWPWTIQVTHIITLLVLTFFTYAKGPLRWLPVVWVVTSIVMAIAAPADARGGWVFGLTFMAVVVALARFLLRTRRQLATSTEQTELAESQKAVLQERARIARDLHDVVAHRMSAVVVMAQTARYRIDGVGEEAAAEFDAIAGAARESLDEVRQLLGVLRSDGEAASAPSPGVGDLESLAVATRRTGTAVIMEVDDITDDVGEASGLVIYRIVQESLANATRHAPGAPITVRVVQAASEDASEIAVINTAPTAPAVGLPGAGTGIPGMIERARAVGGAATAGPMPGGGFGVHALIPNRPDRRVSTVVAPPLGVVGTAPPAQ